MSYLISNCDKYFGATLECKEKKRWIIYLLNKMITMMIMTITPRKNPAAMLPAVIATEMLDNTVQYINKWL